MYYPLEKPPPAIPHMSPLSSDGFRVSGRVATRCCLAEPVSGELRLEHCAALLKSIDVQVRPAGLPSRCWEGVSGSFFGLSAPNLRQIPNVEVAETFGCGIGK